MGTWPVRGQQNPNFWDDQLREYIDDVDASKAPLDSPVFTGNPTAPTPTTLDDDTSIATTAFVRDQGYATETFVTDVVDDYAPLASPALTGNPTAPTPDVADDDTSIATTAFVKDAIGGSAIGGVWATWVPTITASSGTFTTVSGAGRYTVIGKMLFWTCQIDMTTIGTASGAVFMTLPMDARATVTLVGTGRSLNTGATLNAKNDTFDKATIFKYDLTSAIGAGHSLILSGFYELP